MPKIREELYSVLKRLHEGEPIETLMAEPSGQLTPEDLAEVEQQLADSGVSIEEIQRYSSEHTDLASRLMTTKGDRPDRQPGHPAFVFVGENTGIHRFLLEEYRPALQRFVESESREELYALTEDLQQVVKHYDRKENLFFPYLERAGVTVPPQVMWGVDDVIRQLLKVLLEAIAAEPINVTRVDLIANRVLTQIEDMIKKENEILMPMLLRWMNEEDWILAAQESAWIGYVFTQGIEGASASDANTWLNERSGGGKCAVFAGDGEIRLPSGNLTTAQLTAMLNTLPTDLTFVDDQDIIRYYSEGKHQVFTRTRTIIGRDLYLCHAPAMVPVIKKLIQEFRDGVKDEEVVPMQKGNLLNLVRYYAVRDEDGKYMGCVEVTEEISGIIDLCQSKDDRHAN